MTGGEQEDIPQGLALFCVLIWVVKIHQAGHFFGMFLHITFTVHFPLHSTLPSSFLDYSSVVML